MGVDRTILYDKVPSAYHINSKTELDAGTVLQYMSER